MVDDSKSESKKIPTLYALLHIGPTGFNDVELEFVTKLPEDADKAYYTGGEGQCLIFKLGKFDMSTSFYEAFLDGRVSQEWTGLRHPVTLVRKKYWSDGKLFGQSYGYKHAPHQYIFINSGGYIERYVINTQDHQWIKPNPKAANWQEINQEEYMTNLKGTKENE